MDRRSITFLLLSTLIIFGWITIESIFFPPIDPQELVEGPDAAAEQAAEPEPTGADNESDDDSSQTDSEDDSDDVAPVESDETPTFSAEHQLVTLGSLAPDTPYRMLVTFNSRGAAVQRIELADRKKSGQFRYKHVDDRAGYLGNLGVQNHSGGGVVVQVVPPGTPASLATATAGGSTGLQVGDVIIALDDDSIQTPTDYFRLLNRTRPKQELTVVVQRGGETLSFRAQLTARPMEVIEPLPRGETDWTKRHPESFLMTIGTIEAGLWNPATAALRIQDWELVPETPENEIAFRYVLDQDDLAGSKLQGPLTVIKRYRLVRREVEDSANFDRSFHLELDIEFRNEAGEPQQVAFQIDGPTGLPDEGWWYINKIHGRSTALFYTAGVRDVIASSQGIPYRFFGGPEIVSNALDPDAPPLNLFPASGGPEDRDLIFAGVDTQYFNCFVLPQLSSDTPNFFIENGVARTVGDVEALEKKERKRADVSVRLTSEPFTVPVYDPQTGDGTYRQSFTLFAGPKFSDLLQDYGLESTISYGWFAWFSRPLVGLLHFFYAIVGNYGIAIIMLTLLVRAAMIPISRKAALNAQMMQFLQPEMKKINDQYKTDMEKRAKAQRELFARYKYNPMSGCLLMFVQLPIFLGLYRGLSVDMALRDQSLIPGIAWCSNLAGPDRLFYWADWFPFLTSETGWLGPYFNVLPIITIGLFLVQQKLFMPPAVDEQTQMTQRMMTYMMIFMGLLFFKVPSGLCIYFITSSTWGIIERKLLPKPTLDAKLASLNSGSEERSSDVPRERSAAQQRIEEQRRRNRKRKS